MVNEVVRSLVRFAGIVMVRCRILQKKVVKDAQVRIGYDFVWLHRGKRKRVSVRLKKKEVRYAELILVFQRKKNKRAIFTCESPCYIDS